MSESIDASAAVALPCQHDGQPIAAPRSLANHDRQHCQAERDPPEKVCVSLFGTALDASRRVEHEDTDHDHHSVADAHHARSQAACSVATY